MKTQKQTRKTLIAATAAVLMTVGMGAASFASAAPMPMRPAPVRVDMRANAELNARIQNLREDIRMGERTHRLSLREASRLTTKLNAVARLKQSYERHGLTRSEIATLNGKLDVLQGQIRVQAHDGNRR
jgi:hypothetical protein